MKAFKTYSTQAQQLIPTLHNTNRKVKAIICTSRDLENSQKYQMMIAKNYFVRKVSFSGTKTPLQFKIITKRNGKYLRKVKPYLDKIDPRLDALKYAKGLQHLNMAYDYGDLMTLWHLRHKNPPLGLSRLMKIVMRGSFTLTSFQSSIYVFREALRTKKLFGLISAHVSKAENLIYLEEIKRDEKPDQDILLYNTLDKFNQFMSLKNLTLRFSEERRGEVFFLEIFQKLSVVQTLRSLEINFAAAMFEKHTMKMKETMQKFYNLERLKLCINFGSNKQDGKIFANLLPLPNLKSLSLKFVCVSDFDFTNIAKFISSPKVLTTLKFACSHVHFDRYEPIWKAIQKHKQLKNLSLKRLATFYELSVEWPFSYGVVYKLMQGLKALQSVSIGLIKYSQDPDDMLNLPKCLLNCSALQKAKIYVKASTGKDKKKPYDFNSEFYSNFNKLAEKLEVLRLSFDDLPSDVADKLSKMLNINGNPPLEHSGSKLERNNNGQPQIIY